MENCDRSSKLEKLPKNLLALIFGYLELKNVVVLMRLNKFFLNLISHSICAKSVWKNMAEEFCGELDEDQVRDLVNKLINKSDFFEKKMDCYFLYLKYASTLNWDSKRKGKNIKTSPDGKSIYTSKKIFFSYYLIFHNFFFTS